MNRFALLLGLLALPAGAITARVHPTNGVPVLTIDGRATPPLLFFHNTDIPGAKQQAFLRSQVRLAAAAGIHLYSLPYAVPRMADGETPDWANADARLDPFVQEDPKARFLLRIYVGPSPYWAVWKSIPTGDKARFADGSRGLVSAPSRSLQAIGDADLASTVAHCEQGRHRARIIGYQPGAPNVELFHDRYRESGPDLSEANASRFRQWLMRRYRADPELAQAWGRPGLTRSAATLPTVPAARFPMHGNRVTSFFYAEPTDQDWIDYSEYTSGVVAANIERWAAIIKRETRRSKLAVFFYGYLFELPGSFSGHFALGRVLACRDVDGLAAPISYFGRHPGGPGGFMSPVDSVALHGKLWFNEDDTRTHLIRPEDVPPWWSTPDGPTRDMAETLAVLGRNTRNALDHRAGTWWMDLGAAGAFNHPAVWELMHRRLVEYQAILRHPLPPSPELAVVIDERSRFCVADDWHGMDLLLRRLRDEAAMTGKRVGFYLLDDYLAGLTPRCAATLFANAFDLDPIRRAALRKRLDREGGVAIWQYAAGWYRLGEEGVRSLTGIRVRQAPGVMVDSVGLGPLAGVEWHTRMPGGPRLAVEDPAATPLARYASDGKVSAARKRMGKWTSVLVADPGMTRDAIARLMAR